MLELLLGQRDGDVATEVLALPGVAGVDVQLDVDVERLGLAGLQGAEVPAGGQRGDRRQRAADGGTRATTDAGDGAPFGADADRELRVVHVRRRRAVGEVAAQGGDGVDGTLVLDGERLRVGRARLQVVEVEVDDADVVRVVDAELHRGGVDVDAGGVGVVEDRSRAGDDAESEDGSGTDADDAEHVAVALGAVRRVERGVRGHYVPFLQLSCVGCI